MIGSRVFDLPVHRVSRWIFNCYVIDQGHDDVAIVDAGLRSTAQDALDHLNATGRRDAKVSVSATHGHSDHVAGMPLLSRELGAGGFLPKRCQSYLDGETPRVFGVRSMLGFMPMYRQQPFELGALREFAGDSNQIGFGSGGPFRYPGEPSGFLGEGAELPGAQGWEVLEIPGHTDCAVGFYHSDSETLISGDAIVTLDGRAWFNPEWVDKAKSAETEERLRALPVRQLLPGHGLPIAGRVWERALSFSDKPPRKGVLSRCARAFGKWA